MSDERSPAFKYGAIAIIVIAVCAVGYNMFGGSAGDEIAVVPTGNVNLRCAACQHEFTINNVEWNEQMSGQAPGVWIKCPSCGAMQGQPRGQDKPPRTVSAEREARALTNDFGRDADTSDADTNSEPEEKQVHTVKPGFDMAKKKPQH
jgi:hypothetical protein